MSTAVTVDVVICCSAIQMAFVEDLVASEFDSHTQMSEGSVVWLHMRERCHSALAARIHVVA